MHEQNTHTQVSEQQSLPTTVPYTNYAYPHANNFNTDLNQGQYGVMPQYSMYPLNQWQPHPDALSIPSNMTGNHGTIASNSDTPSNTSSGSSTFPIMSASPSASMTSDVGSNSSSMTHIGVPLPCYGDFSRVIRCSSCVLYPPFNPPSPNRSKKPFNCPVIFVGGLPEKATEDILLEVFGRFGMIQSIKIHVKTCTIKFLLESSVEMTFTLNGFEMKIEDKDDPSYTGKLYIDYAQDSEHLKDSIQNDDTKTSKYVACTEREIELLSKKLKGDSDFGDALQILIKWLEKGECHTGNVDSFYRLIQETNYLVQKILHDKQVLERDLSTANTALKDYMVSAIEQMTAFDKVLKNADLQKVWDHFSKSQRKNLQIWSKEIKEYKTAYTEKILEARVEDEMEMSDDEDESVNGNDSPEIDKLSEDIDDLENQLQALKVNMKHFKYDKECEVKAAQEVLQEALNEYNSNRKETEKIMRLIDIEKKKTIEESEKNEPKKHNYAIPASKTIVNGHDCVEITENETRQVCLMASFFSAHPYGASLDYISSYLTTINLDTNTEDLKTRAGDLEYLMKKFPNIFVEVSTGIGCTLKKIWKCTAI